MLRRFLLHKLLLLAVVTSLFVTGCLDDADEGQDNTVAAAREAGDINRNPEKIIYTKHAQCRMECRHITEAEVKEVLAKGKLKRDKINQDQYGTTYPIDGRTSGDKMVRIVVSPKRGNLVLVTVIDLDTDWPCDCK